MIRIWDAMQIFAARVTNGWGAKLWTGLTPVTYLHCLISTLSPGGKFGNGIGRSGYVSCIQLRIDFKSSDHQYLWSRLMKKIHHHIVTHWAVWLATCQTFCGSFYTSSEQATRCSSHFLHLFILEDLEVPWGLTGIQSSRKPTSFSRPCSILTFPLACFWGLITFATQTNSCLELFKLWQWLKPDFCLDPIPFSAVVYSVYDYFKAFFLRISLSA